MVHPRRTARKSTGYQPTGLLEPRDVPPLLEPHPDSPQYVPQGEDSFEIVVMVPVGEDTQEAQHLPQNDDHDNDHEEDETFRDADEIKTVGNEAPIPTGRLRDLLNHLNITTHVKFRIKRVPHRGREEYKAIMEIFSGPNVLSGHKGPAFRATYQDTVADAAW
jgi:hypothetical protein